MRDRMRQQKMKAVRFFNTWPQHVKGDYLYTFFGYHNGYTPMDVLVTEDENGTHFGVWDLISEKFLNVVTMEQHYFRYHYDIMLLCEVKTELIRVKVEPIDNPVNDLT